MHRTISARKHLRQRMRRFEALEQRQLLATLQDPGFEAPVQPANEFEQADGTGNGSLVGAAWTFSPLAGITRDVSPFQNGGLTAPEGNQFGLLQRASSIQQSGAGFVAGSTYVLTVAAALRNQAPTNNNLRILVDGNEVFAGSITNLTFQDVTTNPFVATSATPLIRFETTNPTLTDQTVFIDDIRIDGLPNADAGGPYTFLGVSEITLDATGSSDPDGDPLNISWDIDNDGSYGDLLGDSPTLTYDDLATFGIDAPGTYTIGVEVEANGVVSTDTTTITVGPVLVNGDGNLVVEGGNGSDRITLSRNGGIFVRINNKSYGPFDTAEKIIVYGNNGNDTIMAGSKLFYELEFYGGAGSDYLAGGTEPDLLVGGSGNDRIFGNSGNDIIWGGEIEDGDNSGNDAISTGLGDDIVYGGDGNDQINGDRGFDILYGEGGNDRISGGLDDDIIRGGDGIDNIDGSHGNDILLGGEGTDRIYGRSGFDLILAGASIDFVFGGNDDDLIVADETDIEDAGNATLQALLQEFLDFGDAGLYTFTVISFSPDTIFGEGGIDLIFASDDDTIKPRFNDDIVIDVEP